MHAVVECKRYTVARQQFVLDTGVTITADNYVDVIVVGS